MTGWRIVGGAPVAVDVAPAPPDVDDVVVEVEAAWVPARSGEDVIAGSAAVGRVVAAGAQATALVGARALVGPHLACGDCEVCRRGGAAVCPRGRVLGVDRDGTLAAQVTVPARWVVSLDGALAVPGPAAAAIAGDVAIAYAMYARASIGPREPAVVVGDDAVAGFLVEILAAKGVTAVVVPGADLAAAVRDADALGLTGKPWRLFATTPAARAIAGALVGPRAVVLVRADPGAAPAAAGALAISARELAHEVTVHAVVGAHPDLLLEAAALVARGEVTLAGRVTVVGIDALAATLASPPVGQAIVVALRPSD